MISSLQTLLLGLHQIFSFDTASNSSHDGRVIIRLHTSMGKTYCTDMTNFAKLLASFSHTDKAYEYFFNFNIISTDVS